MISILDAGYECGDRMLREAVERKLEIIDNLIVLAGGRLRSRQIIAQVIADQHERLGGSEARNWDIRESGTDELAERLRVLDMARNEISTELSRRAVIAREGKQ